MSAYPDLRKSESIVVDRSPDEVWDLVSDVTRVGDWSPVCRWCRWDDGDEPGPDGPRVGAGFTGHNEQADRTWETHSEVVVADRGREFAWEVNGGWVRWGFELAPEGSGTRLTETWHFTPVGQAGFRELYGEKAQRQIDHRVRTAEEGIPATLEAIKRIAEGR